MYQTDPRKGKKRGDLAKEIFFFLKRKNEEEVDSWLPDFEISTFSNHKINWPHGLHHTK